MDYQIAYEVAEAVKKKDYQTANSLYKKIKDKKLRNEVSELVKLSEKGKIAEGKLEFALKNYENKWMFSEISGLRNEIGELKKIMQILVYSLASQCDCDDGIEIPGLEDIYAEWYDS